MNFSNRLRNNPLRGLSARQTKIVLTFPSVRPAAHLLQQSEVLNWLHHTGFAIDEADFNQDFAHLTDIGIFQSFSFQGSQNGERSYMLSPHIANYLAGRARNRDMLGVLLAICVVAIPFFGLDLYARSRERGFIPLDTGMELMLTIAAAITMVICYFILYQRD